MTLAEEDTNSMLTDDANRTIQGNVSIQVTQPGQSINVFFSINNPQDFQRLSVPLVTKVTHINVNYEIDISICM